MTNNGVHGVIVAHSDLAESLARVVEKISGIEGVLVAISNDGLGLEALRDRVAAACRGPTLVFVDLGSGSCGMAGRGLAHGTPDVAVLTGTNVPMLLDFVFHRDMPLAELAERLAVKAREGIRACECGDPDGTG